MCRVESPFTEHEKKVEEAAEEEVTSKYALRPPRNLKSKFLQAMEQKEIDKVRKQKQKDEDSKRKLQEELEKPPPDELYGKRIHGWVLMLPRDEKDEMKPFFIETTTGMRHNLDSPLYCSIQSVWNDVNYYVNLQDNSIGLGNLDYDVKNLEKWQHILPGEPINWRVHKKNYDMEDDEEASEMRLILDEKHLDMPEPWSLKINIPNHDVVTRFPQGKKKTMYKRTIVEQYSPYLQEDGLVIKIYRHRDLEYTDLLSIEERYENRNDKLIKRTEDMETQLITEYFERGRDDNAKVHYYYKMDNNVESWRKIEFYYKSRFDSLESIDHATEYLEENYIGREDLFYFRYVKYAIRGQPPPGYIEGPRRIIMHVTEKFKRNLNKRASDDIAVREFDYIGRQMHLKFHYDTGKITASTRTFIKPPLTEMVEGMSFKPELTYGYQAEIGAKPPKNSTLYILLESQLKEEDECNLKIRHVEDSILEFIKLRAAELMHPKLDVGPFNREQNEENRLAMLEKESMERTKKEREIEEDLDFIRPYLVRYIYPETLRTHQAMKVREVCLKEFRDMLVNRANDLQRQFQQQTATIQKKHIWYTGQAENLTFEEQQEYFREMNYSNYILHLLEIRLVRHRDLAPLRYEALVKFLSLHPKLQILNPRKRENKEE